MSQEDAIITFRKSDMKLSGHSDAGYMNNSKECSISGGVFFHVKQSPVTSK